MLDILSDLTLEQHDGIAKSIRTRLQRLATSPGEGCDHAACIITRRINFLFHIDSGWTSDTIARWLNLEHPLAEPAWNGFLHNRQLPVHEFFSEIKPHFCAVAAQIPRWSWDDSSSHTWHLMLVQACLWHRSGRPFISHGEAKVLLQATDHSGRAHCLGILRSSLRNDSKLWRSFVKPFLEQAWPRELKSRSDSTSNALTELAASANDLFPEIVDTIIPLLTRVSQPSVVMHTFHNHEDKDKQTLAARFPQHTLKLLHALIPDLPEYVPFDLAALLKLVGDAEPRLRQDSRWRRLRHIAVGR